ncbi:MAG: HTH-type transcriptional regulator CysB [Pseudomonadota bacterium]
MNIQQLRYVAEIARSGFSVSTAAKHLHTAQPGISSQIRLLEEELGVHIFERHGKRLTGLTAPGKTVLAMAERILRDMENIKQVGVEFSNETSGALSIATTHTQARYVLPPVVRAFTQRYPNVTLHMHQGNPAQVAEFVRSGISEIAIATEALASLDELVTLPCYQWNRCVVAPPGHPILEEQPLTLQAIARYPIVTYDSDFTGRSTINQAFSAQGLEPNVVLTALDADVIKTYVELGLGIGLLAGMAFTPDRDRNLRAVEAGHLFEPSTTRIGFRRGAYLRGYMYAFIELFAPHLTREVVEHAAESKT